MAATERCLSHVPPFETPGRAAHCSLLLRAIRQYMLEHSCLEKNRGTQARVLLKPWHTGMMASSPLHVFTRTAGGPIAHAAITLHTAASPCPGT